MATDRTIVKQVENAVLFSDGTIRVENVRLSYPHIGKMFSGKNKDGTPQTPKYGVVGLLPKSTHKAAKDLVKAQIEAILTEKNKDKDGKMQPLAADKLFLRDGDLSGKAENARMFTINANETEDNPPRALNEMRKILTPAEAAAKFYGGCYGNILIRPWFQKNDYGKRVNSGLVAVQFLRDGEAFGEGRIADEDVVESFGPVGEAESGYAEDGDL